MAGGMVRTRATARTMARDGRSDGRTDGRPDRAIYLPKCAAPLHLERSNPLDFGVGGRCGWTEYSKKESFSEWNSLWWKIVVVSVVVFLAYLKAPNSILVKAYQN